MDRVRQRHRRDPPLGGTSDRRRARGRRGLAKTTGRSSSRRHRLEVGALAHGARRSRSISSAAAELEAGRRRAPPVNEKRRNVASIIALIGDLLLTLTAPLPGGRRRR